MVKKSGVATTTVAGTGGSSAGSSHNKKSIVKFVIDCTQPVEDKVLDVAQFEKYLHDRIKIHGKTGLVGTSSSSSSNAAAPGVAAAAAGGNLVTLSRDRTKLTVASPVELHFSKRQLKYLTKRYLKKQQLKNYLRVVAASKHSYELKYYSINAGEDDDDAGEEGE